MFPNFVILKEIYAIFAEKKIALCVNLTGVLGGWLQPSFLLNEGNDCVEIKFK